MRAEQFLSADMLDILFDNRNKNYGAYELRKYYAGRLSKAIGFTILLAAAAVFILFIFKKDKLITISIPDVQIAKVFTLADPVLPDVPEPVKEKPKSSADVPSQQFVNNILITKNESIVSPLAKNLDSVAISTMTITGDPGNRPTVQGKTNMGLSGPVKEAEAVKKMDKETPLLSADIMPAYPGGMEALRKFLKRHLQNPSYMEEGQTVLVKIKFVVGYDGRLKYFETIEDGGELYNNEVMRVLKRMPDWIPGKTNGENVSVYYTIPVRFTGAD